MNRTIRAATTGNAEDDASQDLFDENTYDEPSGVTVGDVRYMLRFLAPFAKPHALRITLIGFILLIDLGFNISFPLVQRFVIDEGLIAHNWDVVAKTIGYLCFAALAVSGLGLSIDWQTALVTASFVADIRGRLFDRLQTLPLSYFRKNETGAILSRFSGDTVAVEHALLAVPQEFLIPLLEVAYSVALMFYFNLSMGLIGTLVLPLSWFGPKFFAKRAFMLGYRKRQQEASIIGAVQENTAAQEVVRAFALVPRARSRFGALGTVWFNIAYRFNFAGALVGRTTTTGVYLLHLVVFALGALWVWQGHITVGTLVAFEAMFLYMGEAVTWLTQSVPTFAQAFGSIRHLDDLLVQEPEPADPSFATALDRLEKVIEFRDVSFAYPDGRFRIDNFNMTIPRGCKCAIVGNSGSGKSTILALLLRLVEPEGGAILFDGQDLRSVTRASLRAQCAIVFQDSFLFNTSIAKNIGMGLKDATRDEIEAAARHAEIHDFIVSLPKGYETRVGERGGRLSGGQRQRIAIARALVRDPAILLLDEVTSALDVETEATLLATLARVGQDRTVISVTHQLHSIAHADKIIVMDRGKLRESGRHEELVAGHGTYARLWKRQSEGKFLGKFALGSALS